MVSGSASGRGGRRKRFVGQAWYVGRLYNNNTIPPSRACPAPLTRVFRELGFYEPKQEQSMVCYERVRHFGSYSGVYIYQYETYTVSIVSTAVLLCPVARSVETGAVVLL